MCNVIYVQFALLVSLLFVAFLFVSIFLIFLSIFILQDFRLAVFLLRLKAWMALVIVQSNVSIVDCSVAIGRLVIWCKMMMKNKQKFNDILCVFGILFINKPKIWHRVESDLIFQAIFWKDLPPRNYKKQFGRLKFSHDHKNISKPLIELGSLPQKRFDSVERQSIGILELQNWKL